jgi:hypothetical protein
MAWMFTLLFSVFLLHIQLQFKDPTTFPNKNFEFLVNGIRHIPDTFSAPRRARPFQTESIFTCREMLCITKDSTHLAF